MRLEITISGEPVPASRPRFTRRGHTYNAAKYDKYKKKIEKTYRDQFNDEQLFDRHVPLKARIRVYRATQKSLSKIEKQRREHHIHKPAIWPDIDNYEKAIFDGLKKAWADDGQIVESHTTKDYDKEPRVEVEITEIKQTEGSNND